MTAGTTRGARESSKTSVADRAAARHRAGVRGAGVALADAGVGPDRAELRLVLAQLLDDVGATGVVAGHPPPGLCLVGDPPELGEQSVGLALGLQGLQLGLTGLAGLLGTLGEHARLGLQAVLQAHGSIPSLVAGTPPAFFIPAAARGGRPARRRGRRSGRAARALRRRRGRGPPAGGAAAARGGGGRGG